MIDAKAGSRGFPVSKPFPDSRLFEDIIRPMLAKGLSVRFQARGASMSPAIRDGEVVEVIPVSPKELGTGDIVLVKSDCGFRLHRVVFADAARDLFITRGDCGQENDPALKGEQILGLARAKEVRIGRTMVRAPFKGPGGLVLRTLARAQYLAGRTLLLARNLRSASAAPLR